MIYKKMEMDCLSYWDIFHKASIVFKTNIAISRLSSQGSYEQYSYDKLSEISSKIYERLSNALVAGDNIGIFMKHNAFLPAILSVIHRCHCSFIFLDLESDNTEIINYLNITKIMSETKQTQESDYIIQDLSHIFYEPINNFSLFFLIKKTQVNDVNLQLSNIAYYIKTSGSTGIAKNVAVTHKCIFPNIVDFHQKFDMSPNDIIYFCTPLTFDPSVVEIYLAAFSGASLMICQNNLDVLFPLGNTAHLGVTVWQTTPSKFIKFNTDDIKTFVLCEKSSLRVLAFGGEPIISYEKLDELKHKNNTTRIFNLYGITEVSCWASIAEVNICSFQSDDIFIGSPLSSTQIKICDSNGCSITKGIGDILIGSSVRKCLVDKDITECARNPNEVDYQIFSDENVLWRVTGDIGEIKENGKIYFRGRNDGLVKRHGHKVSLIEIENTALKYKDIIQCSCIWVNNDQNIVLFYTSKQMNKQKIIDYLKQQLASHTLPDIYHQIDKIPLTNHGKVSKKKLNDLYFNICKLADCNKDIKDFFYDSLKKILSSELPSLEVLKNESFIDLGGNSLFATLLINKLDNYTNSRHPNIHLHLLNKDFPIKNVLNFFNENYENTDSIKDQERAVKRSMPLNENTSPKKSFTGADNYFEVIWKFNSGKCIDANPTLFTNTRNETFVLVGSHSGKVAVLDAISGAPSFVLDVGCQVEAPILCYISEKLEPCATFGCYDGSLWCFSLHNYKILWKVSLNAMIKSQACYSKLNVFAATYEGIVWSICEKNGSVLSSVRTGEHGITADLIISSAGLVYVATLGGSCLCLIDVCDKLEIKWKTQLSSPVFAKPVFCKGESNILISEVKSQIHCLESVSGNRLWTFSDANGLIFSSCLVFLLNDIRVLTFGCHDCNSYFLWDKEDGEPALITKIKHSSEIYATPCARDSRSIVYASTDGHLVLVSAESQAVTARHRLPGEVFSSPTVKNDLVFVGCRDDNLYCLKIKNNKNYEQ